ncbi:uncharacterized protein EAF01_000460 [Botrytis porri]|uniref:Uncharacterized protein n=1 Tax=Botrytis porri TaxID=87229 RepID=A0A4Z1KLT9_9HELO|nr:uncharacterized protein EAF01_000460 [Botrytis porri]KAF7914054.1 hypothetical protein EAF01_000460 [Botrytis porri]TGO86548.1 hypothetical protein BPOR_0294g00110 [Botrytis porri]
MCLDILSVFSYTSYHDSLTRPLYPGYTIWGTQECPDMQKLSNTRSVRAEFPCPNSPNRHCVNERMDNSRNLYPMCTKHSRGRMTEQELERRRQVVLREKLIAELGLENRRLDLIAWEKGLEQEKENRRQAERTRQERAFENWALERQEEVGKQNVPARRQPSAPKESASQDVARRYVRRQPDLWERGERREEGYRSQIGYSSQVGHSRHPEHARQIEHAKEGEPKRLKQDTKQRVLMSEREFQDENKNKNENENENENESDRIQKQLEQEYIAEEEHRRTRHERERQRYR